MYASRGSTCVLMSMSSSPPSSSDSSSASSSACRNGTAARNSASSVSRRPPAGAAARGSGSAAGAGRRRAGPPCAGGRRVRPRRDGLGRRGVVPVPLLLCFGSWFGSGSVSVPAHASRAGRVSRSARWSAHASLRRGARGTRAPWGLRGKRRRRRAPREEGEACARRGACGRTDEGPLGGAVLRGVGCVFVLIVPIVVVVVVRVSVVRRDAAAKATACVTCLCVSGGVGILCAGAVRGPAFPRKRGIPLVPCAHIRARRHEPRRRWRIVAGRFSPRMLRSAAPGSPVPLKR